MDKIYDHIVTIFVIVCMCLTIALPASYAFMTVENINCRVTEKERIVTQESSKYLIFCEEETLENTDSLWHMKFNSSDVYGSIKQGESYRFKVYGWRIPFMSWYRNIVEINQ